MKIAVTGAAGFIGSHVLDRLVADGHRVIVADDLSRGRKENLTPIDQKELFIGDLSDKETERGWREHLKREGAEILVHVASPMSHNPLDHLSGMEMAVRYLRTCEALGIPTVYISSSSANNAAHPKGLYGEPIKPEGLYGMTKAFIEWGLEDLYKARKVQTYLALRPSNVYGPREVFSGHSHIHVIPSLIRKVMLDEVPIKVWGDGTQTRPFTHVLDVVEAIIRAIAIVAQKEVHDIVLVHGPLVSVRDVLRIIMEKLGTKKEVVFVMQAQVGIQSRELPPPDGELLLGWKPEWSIEQGVEATIDWVKQNPECLRRGAADSSPLGANVA